jgi:hypothetical protein
MKLAGPLLKQASPFNAVTSGLELTDIRDQHEQTGDLGAEEQGDLGVDEARLIGSRPMSGPYTGSTSSSRPSRLN